MKYVFQIVEELVKHVVVEAESITEAEDKVIEAYCDEKIVLDYRDYNSTNFECVREADEDDTSEDPEILEMSGFEFLDEWLKWHGMIGYTTDIIDVIYAAYGIDLTEYPFDGSIERTKEE